MRNRIVPLASQIENRQAERQEGAINNQIYIQDEQHNIQNQSVDIKNVQSNRELNSLQKLNMFLEKMELDEPYEQQDHADININNLQSKEKGNSNQQPIEYAIQIAREVGSRQGEQVLCKICLEDTNESDNILLTPCKCQGSIGFIHQECLKTWIVSQGFDLFAEIRCELCHEEYEMEIEISSKCMPQKLCFEKKWAQIFAFSWLVVFMIGNLFAISFLLYYKITSEDSQWGYIIMAVVILGVFETALVLLIKYYGSELFYGLYVKTWQVLNYNSINENPQRDLENPQYLHPQNEPNGRVSTNMRRRSIHSIRVIQSRSVLSNNNIENNDNPSRQNNQKSLSRLNQSRAYSPYDFQNSKAINYSIFNHLEQKGENNNNNINSYQLKNMTVSQIKANLGLDNSNIKRDEQEQKQIEDKNQIIQRQNSDEQLLNFIKSNIDLYSNIVRAYNNIDNQFMLNQNEAEKNMTILMTSDQPQVQNKLQSQLILKKGGSSKKIIHLLEEQEIEEEEEEEIKKDEIDISYNKRNSNQYFSQSSSNQNQQLKQQNSLRKRNPHLLDIFKQEKIQNVNQIFNEDKQNNIQMNESQVISRSDSISIRQAPTIISSQKVQIVSQSSRVSDSNIDKK